MGFEERVSKHRQDAEERLQDERSSHQRQKAAQLEALKRSQEACGPLLGELDEAVQVLRSSQIGVEYQRVGNRWLGREVGFWAVRDPGPRLKVPPIYVLDQRYDFIGSDCILVEPRLWGGKANSAFTTPADLVASRSEIVSDQSSYGVEYIERRSVESFLQGWLSNIAAFVAASKP